jgi:WD40 repeat protein/serine/threonine protein kinase
MSEHPHDRVKEVFLAVIQAAPGEREAVLAEHCAEDDHLRVQVEALLAADEANATASESFLERPGWSNVLRESAESAELDDMTVVRVGVYEVVRPIGEGGMSIVYEAMQPEPRRRVAVKLIRAPHLSTTVQHRLAREADLLARLDHPGITRVYEAGVAEVEYSNGLCVRQRYQAMEFVDGQPLTTFADTHDLDLHARIRLMMAVCDAVHHAHQQGIIHRDLKPSNILVTASGQPKVLDFGISRLVDASATQPSLSHPGHVLGTLAYMSPEQAKGDDRVDTRTDVYALGVLLFQILSRQLPIDVDEVSFTEALRRIAHAPARRLTSVAPQYRGDLATIVDIALAKMPERRYASAAALSEDLKRFEQREPISARPATVLYVLWKLAERHRLLCASVILAVLATVLGTIGTTWFALSAKRYADASIARERVAHYEAYRSSIAAAAFAIDTGNVGAARRILEKTPADLRNWEWDYLFGRTDHSSLTVPWPVEPGHLMHPNQFVEFTPDGNHLVLPAPRDPQQVNCWDARTGQQVMDEAYAQSVWVTSESDGVVRCEDRLTGRVVTFSLEGMRRAFSKASSRRFEFVVVPGAQQDTAPMHERLTLSPDGSHFVIRSDPLAPVEVWRSQPRERVSTLQGLSLRTDIIRFTEDGTHVLTGSWDGRLRLWEVATGRLLAASRSHHNDAIVDLVIHEANQLVATAAADQTIRIWRLPDLEQLRVLHGHAKAVQHVAFDPAGERLVSADRDCIKVWKVEDPRRRNVLRGHGHYVYGVAFRPDGKLIASACFDGSVGIWDAEERRLVRMLQPSEEQAWEVAFSPNGRWLRVEMDDRSGVLVDPESGENEWTEAMPIRFVGNALTHWREDAEPAGICWDPVDGMVAVVDPQSWEETTIPLSDSRCDHAEFISPDGRFAYDAGGVFDRQTGDLIRSMGRIPVFHPDGSECVTVSQDDPTQIVVWDTDAWQPQGRLVGHTEAVLTMVYSPDGTRLASAGYDRVVRVWDTATRQEILQLNGHTAYVHDLAWSADGTMLVSASGDYTIRVWDAERD